MIKIYQYDSRSVFTGEVREINDGDVVEPGWTKSEIVSVGPDAYNVLIGGVWVALPKENIDHPESLVPALPVNEAG